VNQLILIFGACFVGVTTKHALIYDRKLHQLRGQKLAASQQVVAALCPYMHGDDDLEKWTFEKEWKLGTINETASAAADMAVAFCSAVWVSRFEF
jgi:hypothetical protein